MKRPCLLAVLGLTVFVGASVSPRASQTGDLTKMIAYPPGTVSCGTWLEARRLDTDQDPDVRALQMRAYAMGYLTAYNAYAGGRINAQGFSDILYGTDVPGMAGFLDNHCRENPTSLFLNALATFIVHQKTER